MAEILTFPIENRAEDLILDLDNIIAELQGVEIARLMTARLIREDDGRHTSATTALAELGNRLTLLAATLRQYEVAKEIEGMKDNA